MCCPSPDRVGWLCLPWHTTNRHCQQIRGSIVVSISACHAEDPGSIPGRGVSCCCILYQWRAWAASGLEHGCTRTLLGGISGPRPSKTPPRGPKTPKSSQNTPKIPPRDPIQDASGDRFWSDFGVQFNGFRSQLGPNTSTRRHCIAPS